MKAQLISAFIAAMIALSWTGIGASADAYSEEKESVSCDIDMGGIGGTDIAYTLDYNKKDIAEFLNERADFFEKYYSKDLAGRKFDRLTENDIDFDSDTFTMFTPFQCYDNYQKELTYSDWLREIILSDNDISWRWYIRKNDTIYTGEIFKGSTFSGDHYRQFGSICISSDDIYSEKLSRFGDITYDINIRDSVASAMKDCGETDSDIRAAEAIMGYDMMNCHIIVFADGKAEYVLDNSFAAERLMCSHLRDDTPSAVRKYLSECGKKLETALENKSGCYAVYPYDGLMTLVNTALPWVEEDYLDYLDEI